MDRKGVKREGSSFGYQKVMKSEKRWGADHRAELKNGRGVHLEKI